MASMSPAMGFFPSIASPVSNHQASFHIDAVIPAGVSSLKQRQGLSSRGGVSQNSQRNNQLTSRHTSLRASSSMKPNNAAAEIPKLVQQQSLRKSSVTRGTSQNQRRQIGSSLNKRERERSNGNDLFSAPTIHKNNSTETMSNLVQERESFPSPGRASAAAALNIMQRPHTNNTMRAANNGQKLLQQSAATIKGKKTTQNGKSKLSSGAQQQQQQSAGRFLAKLQQKNSEETPLKKAKKKRTGKKAGERLSLPDLIIAPAKNTKNFKKVQQYEEYKAGQITSSDRGSLLQPKAQGSFTRQIVGKNANKKPIRRSSQNFDLIAEKIENGPEIVQEQINFDVFENDPDQASQQLIDAVQNTQISQDQDDSKAHLIVNNLSVESAEDALEPPNDDQNIVNANNYATQSGHQTARQSRRDSKNLGLLLKPIRYNSQEVLTERNVFSAPHNNHASSLFPESQRANFNNNFVVDQQHRMSINSRSQSSQIHQQDPVRNQPNYFASHQNNVMQHQPPQMLPQQHEQQSAAFYSRPGSELTHLASQCQKFSAPSGEAHHAQKSSLEPNTHQFQRQGNQWQSYHQQHLHSQQQNQFMCQCQQQVSSRQQFFCSGYQQNCFNHQHQFMQQCCVPQNNQTCHCVSCQQHNMHYQSPPQFVLNQRHQSCGPCLHSQAVQQQPSLVHYVNVPNQETSQQSKRRKKKKQRQSSQKSSAISSFQSQSSRASPRVSTKRSKKEIKGRMTESLATQTDEPSIEASVSQSQTIVVREQSNMDMTEPKVNISSSVHVQTFQVKQTRVIETQTEDDPELKRKEIKIEKVDVTQSSKQTHLKTDESLKEEEIVPTQKPVEIKEVGISEKVFETCLSESLSSRAKKKADNLPPADMLFDHLDRVSNKLSIVKNQMGSIEDSNASFASKCSFRQSSNKKRSRIQSDVGRQILRKNTFGTDQDESSEYMEDIDHMLGQEDLDKKKSEKKKQALETIQTKAILKIYDTGDKTQKSKGLINYVDMREDDGARNHFKEFKTPEKKEKSGHYNQKGTTSMLSPIKNLQRTESTMQVNDGSPRIHIVDDADEIVTNEKIQMRQPSSSMQEDSSSKNKGIGAGLISSQRNVQNSSPSKFEINQERLTGGFQSSPNRATENLHSTICDQAQSDHMLSTHQIQSLVQAIDPSQTDGTGTGQSVPDSGTFVNQAKMSKSILKNCQKIDNLKNGGDRAKSVKLDIDAIDEDSSESSVADPPSQHKLQKESGTESSQLQLNVQRVKFDAQSSRSDDFATEAQMGKHFSGIRNSSIRNSLVLTLNQQNKEKDQKQTNQTSVNQKAEECSASSQQSKNDDSQSDNESSSSSSSSSDHETRVSFIARIHSERKRICDESANKVPEIYQCYFKDSDADDDENVSAKRKSQQNKSKDRNQEATTLNVTKQKQSSRNKQRVSLKRQSTIVAGAADGLMFGNLGALIPPQASQQLDSIQAQPESRNQKTVVKHNTEDDAKSLKVRTNARKAMTRQFTFESKDLNKDLHKDLKQLAKEKGVYNKGGASSKRKLKTTQSTRGFESSEHQTDADVEQESPQFMSLQRKISNNNTTIRELPGLEGGTSHNSPNMSVNQGTPMSASEQPKSLLACITEEGKDQQLQRSFDLQKQLLLQKVPQITTTTTMTQDHQSLKIATANKRSITQMRRPQSPFRELMSKEELEAHMLKPFLKRKPNLPFLQKRTKTTLAQTTASQAATLSVYTQKPIVKLLSNSKTQETLTVKKATPANVATGKSTGKTKTKKKVKIIKKSQIKQIEARGDK